MGLERDLGWILSLSLDHLSPLLFFLFLPPTRTRAKGQHPTKKKVKPKIKRDRAKYITRSNPLKVDPHLEYSYCESALATSISPWHIRKLDERGQMFGGGITTASLCGRVKPFLVDSKERGLGGWDLDVPMQALHNQHTCIECLAEYLRQTGA